jgi:hypothetical protein
MLDLVSNMQSTTARGLILKKPGLFSIAGHDADYGITH